MEVDTNRFADIKVTVLVVVEAMVNRMIEAELKGCILSLSIPILGLNLSLAENKIEIGES